MHLSTFFHKVKRFVKIVLDTLSLFCYVYLMLFTYSHTRGTRLQRGCARVQATGGPFYAPVARLNDPQLKQGPNTEHSHGCSVPAPYSPLFSRKSASVHQGACSL